MVAIKAHQAQAFMRKPDPRMRALLFYGTDPGLVSERAEETAKRFAALDKPPGEILRVDDETLADDPDRLIVELKTVSMFGGRKVVRAIAGRRLDGKAVARLLEGPTIDGYLVVEAGNLTPANELRKLFEGHPAAAAVACYPDEAADVAAIVRETLQRAGMSIDRGAIELLVARLGADRALSRNEVSKLALYAHGRSAITAEDVEAVVGDAGALAIDAVVASAADRAIADALHESERALAAGESAQAIIGALQRYFQRLHRVRPALDKGQSIDVATRVLRPPLHFKQQAAFAAHCRAWPIAALDKALPRMAEAQKAARLNAELEGPLLERLLIELAAMGPPVKGGGGR